MKPQTQTVVPTSNLGYTFSLVQIIIIGISLLIFASAGPESTSSGATFGFGGMLVGFIAAIFAPVSFLVFLVSGIKHRSYVKPSKKFLLSVMFQIINIAYMSYAAVIIMQLLRWGGAK